MIIHVGDPVARINQSLPLSLSLSLPSSLSLLLLLSTVNPRIRDETACWLTRLLVQSPRDKIRATILHAHNSHKWDNIGRDGIKGGYTVGGDLSLRGN